jgi:AcrR family transcriptional regulator
VTTRLTRVEQVERNRAQLLATARQVFLRRGYTGATLDAIADEAGFTKGVVYSHFAGKADLFLALLERRIQERAAENERVVEDSSEPRAVIALLRTSARRTTDDADWARLLIEFRAVAARDRDVNHRYAALHERSVARLAQAIAAALKKDGVTAVFPPYTFAQLIFALNSGAVLEQAADPAALPFERLEELIDRLVLPS